jgi:hypothetical protein
MTKSGSIDQILLKAHIVILQLMNLISQTHERMQAPGNKVRKRISTFQYSRNDKKVKRGKKGKRRKAKGKKTKRGRG